MKEKIKILKNESDKPIRNRIYIATPTLGIIRAEWAQARWGAATPCNWCNTGSFYGYVQSFPMGYLVADAQNVAVEDAIRNNAEWFFLLEDDVVVPVDIFLKLNDYMRKATIPIVSGLYYTKGNYSEPLVYRGRGNSFYGKWKLGDKVWCDGVPTGCLLIHMSILKLMASESPEYMTAFGRQVHKVFETPAKSWTDPETKQDMMACGTSDIYWCDRVINEKVLDRSGWGKVAKREFPFLVDTKIKCGHIDLSTGKVY
jgi:hypothetical protein